jgi:transposase
MHTPDRNRISRYKVTGGDHAGLLALIAQVRGRAMRALGYEPPVVSCYEAGYDGFWLHRLLTAAGITNHVFDPASIMVEQRARRAKTERIDGEKLLGTLMAYWRGEPRVVRITRVPSAEQEDARRDSREEERLTREQVGHINRIKALLRLLGMPVGNPRRRDWLAKQRDWQGQGVPPRLLAEIEREHGRLMLVVEQLAKLKKPSASEPLTPAAAEMARRRDMLLRVKSLGPAFSSRLINEAFYYY